MNIQEKISVIIPVYNVEKYLEKCVRSIMDQTYRNLEIICVNDGSPDNSLAVLERLQKEDDRIIILNKENGGLGDARNYGLKFATAEWISFIDSDDWLREDAYEMISRAFESNPDMIHFGMEIVCEDGGVVSPSDRTYYSVKHSGLLDNNDSLIRNSNISSCCRLFRRSVMDAYNIRFEKIYYEDLPFLIQYMLVTKTVYCIQDNLYFYLRRVGSIMYDTFRKTPRAIDHLRGVEYICEFVQKNKWTLHDSYKSLLAKLFSNYYMTAVKYITADKLQDVLDYALELYNKYSFLKNRYDVIYENGTMLFVRKKKKPSSAATKVLEKIFSIKLVWYDYKLYKVVKIFNIPVYKKLRWA